MRRKTQAARAREEEGSSAGTASASVASSAQVTTRKRTRMTTCLSYMDGGHAIPMAIVCSGCHNYKDRLLVNPSAQRSEKYACLQPFDDRWKACKLDGAKKQTYRMWQDILSGGSQSSSIPLKSEEAEEKSSEQAKGQPLQRSLFAQGTTASPSQGTTAGAAASSAASCDDDEAQTASGLADDESFEKPNESIKRRDSFIHSFAQSNATVVTASTDKSRSKLWNIPTN